NSVTLASRNWMTSPRESASRSAPSAVEPMWTSLFSAVRTRRLAKKISIVLASHTVQVTIDAAARPINTAFTTGSALRYMPHGLRSRGSVAVAATLSCASAGTGTTGHAINAAPRSTAALTSHGPRRTRTRPLCLSQSSLSTRVIPLAPSGNFKFGKLLGIAPCSASQTSFGEWSPTPGGLGADLDASPCIEMNKRQCPPPALLLSKTLVGPDFVRIEFVIDAHTHDMVRDVGI